MTAGLNWQDLQIICEDWDAHSSASTSSVGHNEASRIITGLERDDIWDSLSYSHDQPLDEVPAAKVILNLYNVYASSLLLISKIETEMWALIEPDPASPTIFMSSFT